MIEIVRLAGSRNYRLTCEVLLSKPLDEVFEFFADARQLERMTPAWLNFAILTPGSIEMQEGTLIDYKLRVHGIPLRWQSRIRAWDPPYRFVDEQLRGPYRRWYHEHTFEQTEGGTLCRDQVEYSIPGGSVVHSLFVKRDLERIFAYRRQVLRETFMENPHTVARTHRP